MADSIISFQGEIVDSDFIYKMLLKFKGYGNPAGKYWFIGMEEHWESDCVNDVTKIVSLKDLEYYFSNPTLSDPLVRCQFYERASKTTTFETGVKKILEFFHPDDFEETLSSNVFISNARFMPFPDIKKVTELFAIAESDYLQDEKTYKNNLFHLWKGNNHLTFCLSAKYRNQYQEIFMNNDVGKFEFKRIERNVELYSALSGDNMVFQLYHPSSRKFSSYLSKILPIIKANLVIK